MVNVVIFLDRVLSVPVLRNEVSYWLSSVLFVPEANHHGQVEDESQDGGDHVPDHEDAPNIQTCGTHLKQNGINIRASEIRTNEARKSVKSFLI